MALKFRFNKSFEKLIDLLYGSVSQTSCDLPEGRDPVFGKQWSMLYKVEPLEI